MSNNRLTEVKNIISCIEDKKNLKQLRINLNNNFISNNNEVLLENKNLELNKLEYWEMKVSENKIKKLEAIINSNCTIALKNIIFDFSNNEIESINIIEDLILK